MTGLFIAATLLVSSLLTSGSVVTNNDFNGQPDVQQEVEVDAEQPSTFTVSVPVLREIQGSSMDRYLSGSLHLETWVKVDGSIRSDEVINVSVDEDTVLVPDGGLKSPVVWKTHIEPQAASYCDWSGVNLTDRSRVQGKIIRVKVEDNISAGLWRGHIHVNVSLDKYGSLLNEQQLISYVCSDVNVTEITIPKYIIVDGKDVLVRGLAEAALKPYTKLQKIICETDEDFYLENCFDDCTFDNNVIHVIGNGNLIKSHSCSSTSVDVSYDNCTVFVSQNTYAGVWDSVNKCVAYDNKDVLDLSKAMSLDVLYGEYTEVRLSDRLRRVSGTSTHTIIGKLYIPDFVFDCMYYNAFSYAKIREADISSKAVGDAWFKGNTTLTKVTLNDGVKYIGIEAFAGCTSLTDVTIPDSVISIDPSSFAGTPFLDNLKKGVEEVYINGIWVAHGELYNVGDSYVVPADIISMSASIVPDSVTNVSFEDSTRDLSIANSFYNVKSIDVTGRSMRYGWNAYFPNLTKVVLGGRTTVSGSWAWNKNLQDITFTDGLQSIADFDFNHATGFNGSSIYIPKTVRHIGRHYNGGWTSHVFYDFGKDSVYDNGVLVTKGFSEFDVDDDSNYYTDIDGVLYTKDLHALIAVPRAKEFTDGIYVMPDGTTILGELTFSRNFNIHEVVLGDSYNILSSKQEIMDTYGISGSDVLNEGNSLSIAIYQYSDVQKYTVKDTNPYYKSIDGIVYTKDGKELVAVPNHYVGDIVIPEGCEKIRENAFWIDYELSTVHAGITSISLPSTMKYIEPRQLQYLNNKFGTGKITLAAGCDSYVKYSEWIRSRGILPVGTIESPLPYTGQTGTYWCSTGGTNKYNVGVDSNAMYATFEPIYIPEGAYKFSFDSETPVNYIVIFSQSNGKVTSTKTSEVKIPWTYQQSSFTVPSGGRIAWIAATYYNTETKKPINSKMTKDIGDEILSKLVIEKCTD